MPHISQVHFKTSVAAEGSLPLMRKRSFHDVLDLLYVPKGP